MKIVTYNIHKGMDSNNKITLIEIVKYLKSLECNVICLQEVLYSQFLEIKKFLKMEGIFATNVKKPNMLYGICIFTTEEISIHNHVLLTSRKEQRGFLHANIFSDKNINIINTHLGLDEEERKIQIDEILNYAYELKGDMIVCGDFNEKNIYINIYNDSANKNNCYNLCTFPKTNARIDYIFIDKEINIKNYKVDKIDLSDHYPVIVEI